MRRLALGGQEYARYLGIPGLISLATVGRRQVASSGEYPSVSALLLGWSRPVMVSW
jgi:hypothetical protein